MSPHRSSEFRAIMVSIVAVCALGCASALWRPMEAVVGTVVVGLLVLAPVVAVLRWIARRLRWWFEDRADRIECQRVARECQGGGRSSASPEVRSA